MKYESHPIPVMSTSSSSVELVPRGVVIQSVGAGELPVAGLTVPERGLLSKLQELIRTGPELSNHRC